MSHIYFNNFLKNPNELIYKELYNLIEKNIEDKILIMKKDLKQQLLKEIKEELKDQIKHEILEDIIKLKENWTLV